MGYKLKESQSAFSIVDGPDAGQSYKHGHEYPTVPDSYEGRFEKIVKKSVEKKGSTSAVPADRKKNTKPEKGENKS